MLKKFITAGIIVTTVMLKVCTDTSKAVSTLENQGYTKITTEGYAWFMCSEKNTFATKFSATSPNGTRVSGAVCSELLKGNTIRFD